MIDKPYFSVGEDVIIQSKYTSFDNGKTGEVIQLVKTNESTLCPHCGSVFIHNGREKLGYYLDTPSSVGCCRAYAQSSLRKKHGRGMDFERLMETLKTPLEVNT